jgi:hypothetical protein
MTEIARRADALIRKHLALKWAGKPAFGPDYWTEVEALETLLGHEPAVSPFGKACGWAECNCTHQGCVNGFLNIPRPGMTVGSPTMPEGNMAPRPGTPDTGGDKGALFRCPTCTRAQQVRLSDLAAKASASSRTRGRR